MTPAPTCFTMSVRVTRYIDHHGVDRLTADHPAPAPATADAGTPNRQDKPRHRGSRATSRRIRPRRITDRR